MLLRCVILYSYSFTLFPEARVDETKSVTFKLCSFFRSLSPSSLPSRVSEALQQVFSGRAQIRREQLDLERQLKENELRQHYCEKDNVYVQHFCAKEKTEKVRMLAPLAKDPNIPAENQLLSHHFLCLFPIVVLASHLQHYRTESALHSIWLFSAARTVNVLWSMKSRSSANLNFGQILKY